MKYSRLHVSNARQPAQSKPDKGPVATPEKWGDRALAVPRGAAYDLTPERALAILRRADDGDLHDQCVLFEAMEERDAGIGAHIQTRKLGLLSCGYDLQPPDDSAQAGRAVELCEDVIGAIPRFEDAIFDLLDATGKGFSILEIGWDSSEGQWQPNALTCLPQRWFQLAADGQTFRLRSSANHDGIELNPLNFLIHTHRARSGNMPRAGLLRGVVRPFVIRNYGWKDWLSMAELFGMPPRIGTLPDGATEDQKNKLYDAVKALSSDYAAVISEGTRIEFPEIGGVRSTTIFERMIEMAGVDLTLAILGQLLTSRGEQGGSYALGKVQDRIRFDLVESDAKRSAETLTQQFLARIVAFNLGPDAPVPAWHWRIERPEDLPQLATTIQALSSSGLRIPTWWVREKFGVPEPEESDEVLEPPAAPAFPGLGGFGANSRPAAVANAREKKKPTAQPSSLSARYSQ